MSEPTAAFQELVKNVRLLGLRFHELSARQGDDGDVVPDSNAEVVPSYALGIVVSAQDPSKFGLRLRCEIVFPDGSELVAEPEAVYEVTEQELLPVRHAVIVEFGDEVAVMTLLPYLRQALADMSQRVFGSALLMPIMQRGDISFFPRKEAETGEPDG